MIQQAIVTDKSQVHANDEMSHHELSLVPKKRRRKAAEPSKKRRRQGRVLCDLNVDELYIIFAYTYPMDLLNLARSCKSLRSILMHKSSHFLWKVALRQIEGLPACPADLAEPEYTNLVFYARCHACGKPAYAILWNIRRRYCPSCRIQRLQRVSPSDQIFYTNGFLPSDVCKIGRFLERRVDKEQLESFTIEYHQSSDKTAFLNEKQRQCRTISSHAAQCENWQKKNGRIHRFDLQMVREDRGISIIKRLEQRGYGPETKYFGYSVITRAYKPNFFQKHNTLTDNEWDQMWPGWVKVLDEFRTRRIHETVHQPRRESLVYEYNRYATCLPPPNTPSFGLLPHVVDLACFPPFQEIIKAPETTQMVSQVFTPATQLFAPAFLHLPELVGEWKRRLDVDAAKLVKIPSHLSPESVRSSVTDGESHQSSLDKLHLACAVFHVGGRNPLPYPEVFRRVEHQPYPKNNEEKLEPVGTLDRYGIETMEEAAYIVHACGLDPHTATKDDMDRRNARLKCLSCKDQPAIVMDWKHAVYHALRFHYPDATLVPPSESPRWQLISDEHIDVIQTVEVTVRERSWSNCRLCLLCQPRVGDFWLNHELNDHLRISHNVNIEGIERGVHYERLEILKDGINWVEMAEEEGKVIFRGPRQRYCC